MKERFFKEQRNIRNSDFPSAFRLFRIRLISVFFGEEYASQGKNTEIRLHLGIPFRAYQAGYRTELVPQERLHLPDNLADLPDKRRFHKKRLAENRIRFQRNAEGKHRHFQGGCPVCRNLPDPFAGVRTILHKVEFAVGRRQHAGTPRYRQIMECGG